VDLPVNFFLLVVFRVFVVIFLDGLFLGVLFCDIYFPLFPVAKITILYPWPEVVYSTGLLWK